MFYHIMLSTVQYFAVVGLTVLNTTATALALDQIGPDPRFRRAWVPGLSMLCAALPPLALGGMFWG